MVKSVVSISKSTLPVAASVSNKISPSKVLSSIQATASVTPSVVDKIPLVYQKFYEDVQVDSEELVSKIFDYVNLTSSQAVAIFMVDVKGDGKLMALSANGWMQVDSSESSAAVLNGTQKLK